MDVEAVARTGDQTHPTKATILPTRRYTWPWLVGQAGDHDSNCDVRLCDQTRGAWWNVWRVPFAQRRRPGAERCGTRGLQRRLSAVSGARPCRSATRDRITFPQVRLSRDSSPRRDTLLRRNKPQVRR